MSWPPNKKKVVLLKEKGTLWKQIEINVKSKKKVIFLY